MVTVESMPIVTTVTILRALHVEEIKRNERQPAELPPEVGCGDDRRGQERADQYAVSHTRLHVSIVSQRVETCDIAQPDTHRDWVAGADLTISAIDSVLAAWQQ